MYVGQAGGKVKVWDVVGRKQVFSYDLEPPSWPVLCFSLDGSRLAIQSGSGGPKKPFRLIDANKWIELRQFGFGNASHRFVILPGNKELLWPSGDGYIYDLDDGTYRKLPQPVGFSNDYQVAPSSDGRFMILGHIIREKGGALRLWEVATRKTVRQVDTGKMDPTAVAFSLDNLTVAMGSRDGDVSLWDTRTGRPLDRFTGHIGAVRSLAFSRDGKRLASGSADTTILLWDVSKTMSRPRPPAVRLTGDEIRDLSKLLASDDAPAAQRAVWRLVDAGEQTTAFLAKELFVVKEEASPRLRQVRAVQVLESIRTEAACGLLQQLVEKHPAAPVRADAKAALERIRNG
jgi:WD40 repeat protein